MPTSRHNPPEVNHSSDSSVDMEKKGFDYSQEELSLDVYDPEVENMGFGIRRMALTRTFAVCISVFLVMLTQGAGIATVFKESLWDGTWIRMALLVVIPFRILFTLFFMSAIVGSAFQIFGPYSDIANNSRFHSARGPDPSRHSNTELPHVTIQMPVYKEGLSG